MVAEAVLLFALQSAVQYRQDNLLYTKANLKLAHYTSLNIIQQNSQPMA
jgi:hypothetical protein